ncbi:CRISPR-associated helicase/endonuclease Cas3 [Nitrosomonas sp. Nm166]|uniref:CRISPR-associated helicase/endonuclease Cas3 n=1 Tax=Nitrosomonas sp. Nm166 TaxID=1881054 RepID=UPI0008ED4989|nr:CRISPR-associated helicase/endonuclease Cas3 [Nitrosomonas sp. Nm166]SFE83863.1 CRISPR-associated endonuclease/helicase Cas3 [Nitrosomonas sp. Nm166]
MTTAPYYRYWGKASKEGNSYHLLPYHCLDVAAVAEIWLQLSPNLLQRFITMTGLDETKCRAWILFFIAMHDYGKMDLRFQRKAPHVWKGINNELNLIPDTLNGLDIKGYFHGSAGLYWFYQDLKERFASPEIQDFNFDDSDDWSAWYSWMASVVGHHGIVPDDYKKESHEYALTKVAQEVLTVFENARLQWLSVLEKMFLIPAGLSIKDNPPQLETGKHKLTAATMLAGFCSVSDWLGSSDCFTYDNQACEGFTQLQAWYKRRLKIAADVLQASGLISYTKAYQSINSLLENYAPRQRQCLVEQLPKTPGLTLIEASTGSGKTETALAYAWKLIDAGFGDSIVFALPTQATANAMLKRLEKAAQVLFTNQTNVVLVHGRAKFVQNFIDLRKACLPNTIQGSEEAWVQCGQWLAQSRKRVFLGQIGVCTVDQVLVSVLPVKHKFVRGFGIGRSILIIDEVHAYDSYMYGLLDAVLEQQRLAGGSAILLSATLPQQQKQQLAKAWGSQCLNSSEVYPLITHIGTGGCKSFDLQELPKQQPEPYSINLDLQYIPQLLPDDTLIQRLLGAVKQGAQVCVICNLVDVAQGLYQHLQVLIEQSNVLQDDQCLLFHSRYLFADRQQIEREVLDLFGPNPEPAKARNQGHLLIATQVVEQSLDLDFDWLITQLCPVDLLFQRIGRLHRHAKNQTLRPKQFAAPICTVLLPTDESYELHELIYGNSRVLWRTEQCLQMAVQQQNAQICFPHAYREWIDKVYDEDYWPNEPEKVIKSYEAYDQKCYVSQMTARQLINSSMTELADNDSNVAALTRDGEMSLNVVPFYIDENCLKHLLDDSVVNELDPSQFYEMLNLNTVSVPKSWANKNRLPSVDQEGLIWLPMIAHGNGYFVGSHATTEYCYHRRTGLSRREVVKEDA